MWVVDMPRNSDEKPGRGRRGGKEGGWALSRETGAPCGGLWVKTG